VATPIYKVEVYVVLQGCKEKNAQKSKFFGKNLQKTKVAVEVFVYETRGQKVYFHQCHGR